MSKSASKRYFAAIKAKRDARRRRWGITVVSGPPVFVGRMPTRVDLECLPLDIGATTKASRNETRRLHRKINRRYRGALVLYHVGFDPAVSSQIGKVIE